MGYIGSLNYAEIKLFSQIKLDTIHNNSFVNSLIICLEYLTCGK